MRKGHHMHPEIQFAIKVFAALFAIMNPIANIPIFLSLTEGRSDAERRRIASVAILGVVVASLVSVFAGQAILTIFGLTIDDFRLAGGLIVLLIALAMLHGSSSAQHQPDAGETSKIAGDSVAVYPLTIPLLVGPGTISTLIVFGHAASFQDTQIGLGVGLFAMIAVLAVALWSAPFIGHYLSASVSAVTKRLMGMILAAIAVEMIVTSLRASFKGLAG
ncbi:MarC family protein [Agrobacterium leguminum]